MEKSIAFAVNIGNLGRTGRPRFIMTEWVDGINATLRAQRVGPRVLDYFGQPATSLSRLIFYQTARRHDSPAFSTRPARSCGLRPSGNAPRWLERLRLRRTRPEYAGHPARCSRCVLRPVSTASRPPRMLFSGLTAAQRSWLGSATNWTA